MPKKLKNSLIFSNLYHEMKSRHARISKNQEVSLGQYWRKVKKMLCENFGTEGIVF